MHSVRPGVSHSATQNVFLRSLCSLLAMKSADQAMYASTGKILDFEVLALCTTLRFFFSLLTECFRLSTFTCGSQNDVMNEFCECSAFDSDTAGTFMCWASECSVEVTSAKLSRERL